MTHYNYYEQMQELSFRASMALTVLGNVGLSDFYSAAEEGFYQKLQTVSVEDAKKNITRSQIDQYLVLKDFVDDKEREAAEKLKEEQIKAAESFKPVKERTQETEEEAEKAAEEWAEDCQVYEDKMQAKIKAMHD